MNRFKKFIVSFAVMVVTHLLHVVGFGLRQVVKFAGLDPDQSPYAKHLAHLKLALDTGNHESAYETDFNPRQYLKLPSVGRPSFKFKKSETLKITDAGKSAAAFLEVQENETNVNTSEDIKPNLKELVSKIQKAAATAPKKTVRVKPRKTAKKSAKKVA